MFDIQEELKKLPAKPGVYMMKNENDKIIYVGKAKVLKNRVKQYFGSNVVEPKTVALVSHIKSFEYIVTESELEALVLECNLIKKFKPKYNILLKYSKTYPYIKILTKDEYPKVVRTNNYVKDGSKYFGPYVDITSMNEILELITQMWNLRSCNLKFPRDFNKSRPCLNFHIGRCMGICEGKISQEQYKVLIDEIIDFLNGNTKEVVKKLTEQMNNYSLNMDYENALKTREQIYAIDKLSEKQKAIAHNDDDTDVIGITKDNDKALVQLFIIRSGKMIGREQFVLDLDLSNEKKYIVEEFIKQYYTETTFIPQNIIINELTEEMEIIEDRLSEFKGARVKIVVPLIGEKLKLLQMANQNAEISFTQFGENLKREYKKTIGALNEIKELLGLDLDNDIIRIEAYDISNTSGVMSVGSMIVFENGKPKSSDYRKFKIKGVVGANDYASIEEVITRRFKRYIDEKELDEKDQKFTKLPDILFIDGGKGQVSSAIKALNKFNINIPVAGMVKDDKHRTKGLLYNNNEIIFKNNSEGFKLLTRIQDEVHRFAIEYHKKLRDTSAIKSVLDDIEGVGAKRRALLLNHFGSVDSIKKASIDEIKKVETMNEKVATNIVKFFEQE